MDERRQERIRKLSGSVLATLERIADEARSQLQRRNAISTDRLAQGNTLNSPETTNSLNRIARDVLENAERLAAEPAIARVRVADDDEVESVYYISRGASSLRSERDQHFCSHYAPAGGLASIPPGGTMDLWKGSELVTLRVIERTLLHPGETGDGWDSLNSEFEDLEAERVRTVTIQSLLRLLGDALASDDPLAAIEKIIEDAESGRNVIEGRIRRILRKAELRDQAVLDQYQSKIFRLPVDRQLVILGSPGTGKTTTLIRRLGQKLNYVQLPDDEKALIDSAVSPYPHASSWLMFTPTELLRSYLKEAFAKENVPASDNVVRTWAAHRRDIARNTFGLLRVGSTGRFLARDDAPTLRDETVDQIAWYEDFQTWQAAAFRSDLASAAELLTVAEHPEATTIGARLKAVLDGASSGDGPSTILALVGFAANVRGLVDLLSGEIDQAYKRVLATRQDADPGFFASLMAFMDGLTDVGDQGEDADDEEDEDEEEPVRAVTGPAAARKALNDALRRQARQHVTRRRPGRSVAAQVLHWLGDRGFDEEEREAVGRRLLLVQALRRFVNPVRSFVLGVPARYARFRRARRAEGRWYTDAAVGPLANDFEIDIVLLAILRSAGVLLSDPRIVRALDEPAYSSLGIVVGIQRNQILVDEATDFSPIQLGCMRALASFSTRSFFACGDFDQRITAWGSRRRSDLEWVSPGIDVRAVSISYRQSRQLFDFSRALAAMFVTRGDVTLPPEVNNDAVDPVLLLGVPDVDGIAIWLAARIGEIEEQMKGEALPTVAVLVHEEAAVKPLTDALNRAFADTNLRAVACVDGRIIGSDDEIRVFDVRHVKGLEFEAVFFIDVDRLAEAMPELFDKYLYVGATRAATYLGMTCSAALPAGLDSLRQRFASEWS